MIHSDSDRAVLRFGPFSLDAANARLLRDGQVLEVVPKDLDVLCFLARRPGQLVTKDQLLDAVWERRFVSESVLKNVISRLRALLGDDARQPRYIETAQRRGYRFIAELQGVPTLPAAGAITATAPADGEITMPIIGRDDALDSLQTHWSTAAGSSRRRLVLLAGEPGIGKTTLIDHFVSRLGTDVAIGRGQCVEQVGAGTPYLPMLEALNGLCQRDTALPALLRQVAPTWLLQLPWFVPSDAREALQREISGATPERMLREMGELLDRLSQASPVLLVFEDLHWSDPLTVQLIGHVARRRGPARLMVLGSFRPTELILDEHPLGDLRRELKLHRLCEELHLEGLNSTQVGQFLSARCPGGHFSAPFVAALHRHTEGLPLFLSSVVDELMAGGTVTEDGANWSESAAATLPVPADLAGVIERQLQRLSDARRGQLEAAALCPATFDGTVLAEAMGVDARELRHSLDDMVRRELWLRATTVDGRYVFRHALLRHVCSRHLVGQARADMHRRLGEALEKLPTDARGERAAELGWHAEHGGQAARAAGFYAQAAASGMRRLAPHAALAHTRHGLALIDLLPAGSASDVKLQLLSQATLALVATQGYAADDTVEMARRAFAIIASRPLSAKTLPLWHGRWWIEAHTGQSARGEGIARRLMSEASASKYPMARGVALNMAGIAAFYANRPAEVEPMLSESLAIFDADAGESQSLFYPQDLRMEALVFLGISQELLGHFANAAQTRARVVALVDACKHRPTDVMGLWSVVYAHFVRDEPAQLVEFGERALAVAARQAANPSQALIRTLLGWGYARQGDAERGAALAREGMALHVAQRALMGRAAMHYWLASTLFEAGELEMALAEVDAALAAASDVSNSFDLAGAWRLRGELCWRLRQDAAGAELAFERAVDLAVQQRSVLLRVHALCSLAALRKEHGRPDEAMTRLGEALEELNQKSGAPKLVAVRRMLDSLRNNGEAQTEQTRSSRLADPQGPADQRP